MLCQSVWSVHSPVCWSFCRQLVAIENVATDVPFGVNLDSASLPNLPIRITLLTLRDAILPSNVTQESSRRFGRESVDRGRLVALARFQHHGREARLIGRVGVMLRLEAESVAPLIRFPALAVKPAVQLVARVELHAGLCGQHFHYAAGF